MVFDKMHEKQKATNQIGICCIFINITCFVFLLDCLLVYMRVLSVCYAISVVYSCLWCVLNHPLSNELSTSRYNRIIKITQVVAHFRNKEKISFALTEIVLQYYFKSPVVKSTGLTHINRNFSCSYLNINACFDGAIMV